MSGLHFPSLLHVLEICSFLAFSVEANMMCNKVVLISIQAVSVELTCNQSPFEQSG